MVKEYNRHLIKKGCAIKYHLDKGESIYKISKELKVSTSTVHYYKKRPELLKCKRASKLIRKKLKKKRRKIRKINKDLRRAKNYVKRKNRITELYRAQTDNKSKKDIEIQNYNFKIS